MYILFNKKWNYFVISSIYHEESFPWFVLKTEEEYNNFLKANEDLVNASIKERQEYEASLSLIKWSAIEKLTKLWLTENELESIWVKL